MFSVRQATWLFHSDAATSLAFGSRLIYQGLDPAVVIVHFGDPGCPMHDQPGDQLVLPLLSPIWWRFTPFPPMTDTVEALGGVNRYTLTWTCLTGQSLSA